MKCSSCNADNAPNAVSCEYCGEILGAKSRTTVVSAAANAPPGTSSLSPDDFAPSKDDPGFQLWNSKLPKNDFRWWAFFFPIAYLAGYGAKKSAVAVGVTILAPVLIFRIVHTVSWKAAAIVQLAMVAYLLFYSYKVAIHADSLTKEKSEFNMPIAIGMQVIYTIIYSALG